MLRNLMVAPDTDAKMSAGFRALRGRILSYNHDLKKYRVRPDIANYDIIECPALDVGVDCPFAPKEEVLLQRIANQGWLIMGRIPVARDTRARTTKQLPESEAESAGETSFQEPDNDEALFHAQPGDMVVRRGKVKMILSAVGVIGHKVSDTCARFASGAKSKIIDRCFNYVLSIPRATINLFYDRTFEEPKLEVQLNPQNPVNAMRLAVGGRAAGVTTDGVDLAMGEFTRLLFQFLPLGQRLVYTQNEEQTKVEISVTEFLVKFSEGVFQWTSNGLVVYKGETTINVLPESLVISSPNVTLTADALEANVTGTTTLTTQALIMQQFHWLTVVQRLNSLLLNYQTHVHVSDVPGAPTSVPTGNPVNEKGTPIGTPIAAGEPPLSV